MNETTLDSFNNFSSAARSKPSTTGFPPELSKTDTTISVVIVTYDSADDLERCLPPLLEELGPSDELVIIDNASTDATVKTVARLAPQAHIIASQRNTGFAEGCNIAADQTSGDILLFLNPDAVVCRGFGQAIRKPATTGRDSDMYWDAWHGLVVEAGREIVNSAGNVVHFTGIGWAGQAGTPLNKANLERREVPYLSGACLAVRREVWQRLKCFPPEFFMYQEDLDLSLRIRLAGGRIGFEPDARVEHDYVYEKGMNKWRLLERNRWSVLIRCYPGSLLVALAPALIVTEFALIAVAARGGWLRAKLKANIEVLRALPRLLRERRAVQQTRTITTAEFARWLTPDLTSPYLGSVVRWTPLRKAMRGYWALVRYLIKQ